MGSKMNAYDDKEHTLLNMHSSEDGSAQQTQTEIIEKKFQERLLTAKEEPIILFRRKVC
jgi:hypothetical protein